MILFVVGRSPRLARGRVALLASVVAMLLAPVLLSSGCSAGVSEAVGTPAPASAAAPAGGGASAVWPYITVGQDPLFDLNVTEAPGFTKGEQDYLRSERISWAHISGDAKAFASVVQTDPEAADDLLLGIEMEAKTAGAAPPPSARFEVLRDSVARLMDRALDSARAARSYQEASTNDERSAAETQLVRLASPLPKMLLWVGDWGLAMYDAYGGIEYPVYYAAPAAAATTETPTTTTTTTETPSSYDPSNDEPQPHPEPQPEPQPSLTAAEEKQVAQIAELNNWLMPVVTDSLAQVSAQTLPWDASEVESFCLNMTYLADQSSLWLGKSPAGSHIRSGVKEYQQGLALVLKGAQQMSAAAGSNDTGHQKALDKGAKTMESALPYLSGGMAKLERLY